MSSLWTPGGEHPVEPERAARPSGGPTGPAAAGPADGLGGIEGTEDLSPEDRARAEAMAQELAEVQRRLAEVPAAMVVANHVMGFFELGAIHLNQQPPNLPEAAVAIDAMGAVIERLAGRLGEDEATLRSALDQIRMAFVQLQSAARGDTPPPTG